MGIEYYSTAFSDYRILKQHGCGGSGIIYKVENDDHELFALKRLTNDKVSRQKLQRFKNEIQFCLRNNHKNIIRIYDYGFVEIDNKKYPFYIMPFYENTLRNLMNEQIKIEKAISYFCQILDGVEAAHLKGYWHRDIKPENILYDKQRDNLIVTDFGIAHFAMDSLYTPIETLPHDRLANFQYAAPEQRMAGKAVDHRADIYALGLILNEIFTGEVIQGIGFKKIGDVCKEYGFIDNLIEKMVAQSPKDRFDSIDQVKNKLKGLSIENAVRQRLSELESEVIPESEIDDKIFKNPIKLKAFDYKGEYLTLILTDSINEKWEIAFREVRIDRMLEGYGPENFKLINTIAIISAPEELVQKVIDDFKKYITKANENYRQKLVQENNVRIAEEKKRLIKETEEEERRLRILKNTHI